MTSVVIDLIRSFEGGLNVIDLEILNNVLNSKIILIISSQQKQFMVSNIFSVFENRWFRIFYEMWFWIVHATSHSFSLSSTGFVVLQTSFFAKFQSSQDLFLEQSLIILIKHAS